MKDENLLSSMEDRNTLWTTVFQRTLATNEWCEDPIEVSPDALGRILADANLAAVLKERLDKLRHKAETINAGILVPTKKLLMDQIRDQFATGGAHLGAARSWIQHTFNNGSQVTWGSLDELGHSGLSVKRLEQLAEEIKDAVLQDIESTVNRATQDKPAPKHKPSETVAHVSKKLLDLSQKIRKEHVPSGGEQMANITGEDMLDIALQVKALGERMEDMVPYSVYVEQDEDGDVVGVYADAFAEFEYPENGTQTPYPVKGAPKPDAKAVWRVVWLDLQTLRVEHQFFWNEVDAEEYKSHFKNQQVVGIECVEVK